MDCSIIYYSAVKTGLCEKALKKSFAAAGLTLDGAVFVTKPAELGRELKSAFARCDVVFTVGGLCFSGSRNTAELVSAALGRKKPVFCRRLSEKAEGYLLRSGNQILVLLPDDPAQIEGMVQGDSAEYINAVYSSEKIK